MNGTYDMPSIAPVLIPLLTATCDSSVQTSARASGPINLGRMDGRERPSPHEQWVGQRS